MARDNIPNVTALISQPEDICLPVMTFLPSRFRPKWSPGSPSTSPCWSIFPPLRSLGFVLSPSISNTFSSSLHVVFYLDQEKFCSWQEIVLSLKCAGSRLVSGWRNNLLDLLRSLLSTCVSFSVFIPGGECQWSGGKAPDVSFLSESAEDAFSRFLPSHKKQRFWTKSFSPNYHFRTLSPLPHGPQH